MWQHFTPISGDPYHVKCDLCSGVLSYKSTIGNLKKHLMRKHPNVKIGSRVFVRTSENAQRNPRDSSVPPGDHGYSAEAFAQVEVRMEGEGHIEEENSDEECLLEIKSSLLKTRRRQASYCSFTRVLT